MKAQHRLAMCHLAIRDESWLAPCDRTDGSGLEYGLRRRPHPDVRILVVMGPDRAMGRPEQAIWRRPGKEGIVTVCVGRAGETERVLEYYNEDVRANLIPDPSVFLFITQDVGGLSSTTVRQHLRELP